MPNHDRYNPSVTEVIVLIVAFILITGSLVLLHAIGAV